MVFPCLCLALACACQSPTQDNTDQRPQVTVLLSWNGLGDMGLNDMVYESLRAMQVSSSDSYCPDIALVLATPTDSAQLESMCEEWFSDCSDSRKRLLILVETAYAGILEQHPAWRNQGNSKVAIFNQTTDDPGICSITYSNYGVYYELGLLLSAWNQAAPGWGLMERFQPGKAAIVCANREDESLQTASQAVLDAVAAADGPQTDVFYLSERTGTGYGMADSVFNLSYRLDKQDYGFVVPLCGGSQMGMLRYTRENVYKGTFNICCADSDLSQYSNAVVCSTCLNTGQEIVQFIQDWNDDALADIHYRQDSGDGDISLAIPEAYRNYFSQTLGLDLDQLHRQALEAEQQFLNR